MNKSTVMNPMGPKGPKPAKDTRTGGKPNNGKVGNMSQPPAEKGPHRSPYGR